MTSPVVARGGIQMIAYCGHKIIKAPEITQKQVENRLINQQFAVMARRLLRDLRQDAVVEFR
jgi:peptidyl-prolyl cis-trans isomerase SurA